MSADAGTWTIYHEASGRVVSVYTGPDVALNTPAGCAAMQGTCDPSVSRVQLVVDDYGDLQPAIAPWVPPAPPDDEWQTWAWDETVRAWRSSPTLAARKRDRVATVQAQIEALEAQQLRPQRDVLSALTAGLQPPAEAVQRLQDIEAAIVPLRATRAAIAAAASQPELDAINT